MAERASSLASLSHLESDGRCAGVVQRFDSNSIVATCQGSWLFSSDAAQVVVDAGTLVVGNPGDDFVCRHPADRKIKAFAARLLPGAVDGDVALFLKRTIDSLAIGRLFLRALRAAGDDDFDSIIFTIFSEASARSLYPHNVASRLRTERAKRFIEAHAFEPVTLTDLANELSLSPFTLIRQFRSVTGKTPHAYLLEVRLDAAKQLLKRSGAPVESIAKSVGFDDSAYFARFFKNRTGVTPSRFRVA